MSEQAPIPGTGTPAESMTGRLQPDAETSIADVPEEELWEDRCSPKSFIPEWILWVVVVLILFIGVGLLFEPSATVWWVLVAIAVAAFLFLVIRHGVQYYSLRYRLTTKRLFVEKGVFAKRRDQNQLVRVDDAYVEQSFFQRIVGIGNVTVTTPSDPTDPTVKILNIATPDKVADMVIKQRDQLRKRALYVDNV